MIGSVIAWHLNTILDRKDIIIVDDIQHPDQWNNLSKRTYIDYLNKDDLFPWLEKKQDIEAIIHMGAISATTYRDWETDRKSTRLNSSHSAKSRMPSSA